MLFAGAAGRKAVDYCEVELLFDNADGDGPVDYSELSITRRLHRGGEGQYLVNRAGGAADRPRRAARRSRARRRDALDHRPGQGRGGALVVARAAARDDRGGGRPRPVQAAAAPRRAEARSASRLQVERARDVEAEVKKRLRPLALQATAAERAEKLGGEIASLQARIAQLDLAALGARRAEGEERRTAATLARRRVNEQLESLLVERNGRRGGARRRRREARGGDGRALPAAQRRRAFDAAARVDHDAAAGLPSAQEAFSDGAELRRAAAEAAAAASAAAKERASSPSGSRSSAPGSPHSSARSQSARGFHPPPVRSRRRVSGSRSRSSRSRPVTSVRSQRRSGSGRPPSSRPTPPRRSRCSSAHVPRGSGA